MKGFTESDMVAINEAFELLKKEGYAITSLVKNQALDSDPNIHIAFTPIVPLLESEEKGDVKITEL